MRSIRSRSVCALVGAMMAVCPAAALLAEEENGSSEPFPMNFSVDYTIVSDYVFRGVNLSEFSGEGAERPNHQLNVAVSYDTGRFGTFSVAAWFEWFGGQTNPAFDSDAHGHLQEVDYTISWSFDLSTIAPGVPVTLETGWICYTLPQEVGDIYKTNEWYVKLSLDDSTLFGTESAVLSPYVAHYLDVDDAKGSWIEIGVSHDFPLAECLGEAPVLKHMTVTPSAVLGIDHRYLPGDSTRLANLNYGLAIAYDLTGALNVTERYGSVTVTGFANYSQGLSSSARAEALSDEFYGGLTIGYAR